MGMLGKGKTATDCPYYDQGACTAGGGGFSCSIPAYASYEACAVYSMHGGTAGLRTCTLCGTQWRSARGAMQDMGLFGGRVSTFYNRANLIGLTCVKCGNSFCKKCLKGGIPSSLPGGSCPSCGGKLNLTR